MMLLRGRRIALVGLADDDATALRSALEREGAFHRTVNRDAVIPAIRTLETFDAVILGIGTGPSTPVHQGIIDLCAAPVLVVASEEELRTRIAALCRITRGYAVRPGTDSEVVLRLATLLRLTEDVERAPIRTIVIADDDPVISAVLESTLSRHGFACHVAEDGDEALLLARHFQPDAVILDVNMPGRDGFSVLREIRRDEKLAAARVLMLTGRADQADVRRGCNLGTDEYVLKPFNASDVAARVKALVGV